MSGGKGGSTTSSVEVPQYIEDAAKRNLLRAQDISQIGYTPYYGPDVAALTPMQEASFAGTQELASAFGAPTAQGGVSGMPEAQTFAGGIRGYSSAPLFEESLDEFGRRRPAQKAFIDRMFIDPVTGGYTPISPDAPVDVPVDAIVGGGGTGGGGAGGGGGFGGGAGGGGGVPFVPITPDVPFTPVVPFTPITDDTGANIVNVGGEPIVVGGTPFDDVSSPVDTLTDQEIRNLADLGLAGTVDFGLKGGTTFIPTGSDMSETDALRERIGGVMDIATERDRERADAILREAEVTGASVADIAQGIEATRDRRFGTTATGTATQLAGMQVADAYDPRAASFGQPTVAGQDYSFTDDLTRSLTDPNYDPEGTVLSRALGGVFGATTPETEARLADEIAARQASTENSAQRRASELSGLIETVGGQELLDTGAQLAGDQTMALERQFGTLTTSDVVDQANLSQQSIPTGKGSLKDTRKVLDQAAQEGNLGAYVDSFMDKYGGDLNRFQEKTGISNAVMKDIEKIAAAKG